MSKNRNLTSNFNLTYFIKSLISILEQMLQPSVNIRDIAISLVILITQMIEFITPDDFELSAEEKAIIQVDLDEIESLRREKRQYDREENRQIDELKEDIAPQILGDIEQIEAEKSEYDRQANEEIKHRRHEIDKVVNEAKKRSADQMITDARENLIAIANTLKEEERLNCRNSEISNTPPSQQGLQRPNVSHVKEEVDQTDTGEQENSDNWNIDVEVSDQIDDNVEIDQRDMDMDSNSSSNQEETGIKVDQDQNLESIDDNQSQDYHGENDQTSQHEKGQPRRGAPKGHPGYKFVLPSGKELKDLAIEEITSENTGMLTELIILEPTDLPDGLTLEEAENIREAGRRVEFDMIQIPVLKVYVQEQATFVDPANKRKRIKCVGQYPKWLKKSWSYSPAYHAQAVYMRMKLHNSYHDIARYFRSVFGVTITAQTIHDWVQEAAQEAKKTSGTIKSELQKAHLRGVDETGIRDNGTTHWVYVVSNEDWTWMTSHEHRNFESVVENGVLLDSLEGTYVIHDNYNIYDHKSLEHLNHGFCHAHGARAAKQVIEYEDESAPLVQKYLDWLDRALNERNCALEKEVPAFEEGVEQELINSLQEIVETGYEMVPKTKNMFKRKTKRPVIRACMKRILKKGDEFFDFLSDLTKDVPWFLCELSGRKPPQLMVELSLIANEIDVVREQALKKQEPLKPEIIEELKSRFSAKVREIYDTYKDSTRQFSYHTKPGLVVETTLAHNFFKLLKNKFEDVVRFITDLGIDTTNNGRERDLRPLKTLMKVTGGFRGGSENHMALESYLSSGIKQDLEPMTLISELVNEHAEYLIDKDKKHTEEIKKIMTESRVKNQLTDSENPAE